MRFLQRERDTLERLLPGLDKALAEQPLSALETPGGPALTAFRDAGGPALLVPESNAGLGADPLAAVRVQRAVAARSPSLAVATTMHHFSVASLVGTAATSTGFEWMMLEAIASNRLLVASGFAEGRPGQAILSPTMHAELADGQVRITGRKRPCSLAHSMDLLTASVTVPCTDGPGTQMAVALIPRNTPGLSVEPFWGIAALAGAESDEVVLSDVAVPPDLLVRTGGGDQHHLDHLQTTGFLWFELLMSASYLGMASALADKVLAVGRAAASIRADLVIALDAAMAGVEGVARAMHHGLRGEQAFADALVVRYATQDAIARATHAAVTALGGMAYISDPDVAYLASCTACLAFHPPSRAQMAQPICDWLAGEPLRVGKAPSQPHTHPHQAAFG